MDLKWQVAMISIRLKKFYKKTEIKLQFDAKELVGVNKTKVGCFNCHKIGHFDRECRLKRNQDIKRRDAGNTGYKAKDNGRRPGKQEEPKALVTLDGDGVDWTGHAEDEQKNFALMAYSHSGSDIEVTFCLKECEESYAKLRKLYDEQREQLSDASIEIKAYTLALAKMSVKEKIGLGFSEQVKENELYDEALISVFDSHSSDIEDAPVYDRFAKVKGMHAVPPPMTGNYMPPKFDFGIDESYVETLESVPEPVVIEPKVVSQPKVWSDAPIIEEYESDSDDEYVIKSSKEQETPSFAFVNTVKHVKTPREIVKEQNTCNQSLKVYKRDWNGLISKKLGLGYGFTRKACFVCGSFGYLIRDYDFHEKRLAKQVELNKKGVRVLVKRRIDQYGTILRPIFNKTHPPIRRPSNRTTAPKTDFSNQKVNTGRDKAVSAIGGIRETAVKTSTGCNWRSKRHYWNKFSKYNGGSNSRKCDDPQQTLKGKGIVYSGCSMRMTGNKAYLVDYQEFKGGSIMCDKKNKVLFTDTECLMLSPDFKLPDENQVLLIIPRQNNMYSFNLENIIPTGGLACLIEKATVDESNKWHRRLGHVNFKNLNKLVKGNLVRGLPSKIFQNDHTCVVCQKGKQHKASCKAKLVSSISQPLQLLHMDLFGPTSVRSINHKTYCLVITDDFSRFSWVFFLRTKDETSGILKDFIRQIENQLNQKVKTIRCDNGTEFKNRDIIEFCGSKGIKREYSNARTPQQNGVAERKNRTLIEAARTMLADSFLPNTFWAEAVSTACYVLNRVLVTKPQNKTPYELITGKIPIISYIRPFGCHVTILNTIDHLGKFEEKSDEGFLVGYSLNSKAFREKDLLGCTQDNNDAGNSEIEAEPAQEYFVLPLWFSYTSTIKSSKAKNGGEKPNRDIGSKTNEELVDQAHQVFLEELERLKRQEKEANDVAETLIKEFVQDTEDLLLQAGAARANSTNYVNTASTSVNTASPSRNVWTVGLSYPDPSKYANQDDS
ncbi:putative ribonuclease H-like domain-containing protein [Tanacetum coccineum]